MSKYLVQASSLLPPVLTSKIDIIIIISGLNLIMCTVKFYINSKLYIHTDQ